MAHSFDLNYEETNPVCHESKKRSHDVYIMI